MFGSTILEVAIGLVFVYLLLSLICSTINEIVAAISSWRANTLWEGVRNLLDDSAASEAGEGAKKGPSLAERLYAHPLISGLARKRGGRQGKPSYIPAQTFATALLHVLREDAKLGDLESDNDLRATLGKVPNARVRKALIALYDDTHKDFAEWRERIADWFDDSMDRVSGWYRRNAQKWLLGIAVVVVVVGNVDTITLAHSLARNDTLRAAVVAAAETRPSEAAGQEVAEGVEQQPPTAELGRLITELEALALPIGWVSPTDSATVAIREVRLPAASAVLAKLGGLALTALAVALGAPFWFSLLNNLVNLRASGGKPQPAASRTPRKTQGSTGEGSAK